MQSGEIEEDGVFGHVVSDYDIVMKGPDDLLSGVVSDVEQDENGEWTVVVNFGDHDTSSLVGLSQVSHLRL
jgi:hypothetical protein